jgi:hypothetical protein
LLLLLRCKDRTTRQFRLRHPPTPVERIDMRTTSLLPFKAKLKVLDVEVLLQYLFLEHCNPAIELVSCNKWIVANVLPRNSHSCILASVKPLLVLRAVSHEVLPMMVRWRQRNKQIWTAKQTNNSFKTL